MPHSETVTAVLTATEPTDGTKLIVVDSDDNWTVIVRDDDAAEGWDAAPGDHWFAQAGVGPMSLHQHLKYADAVYALGEKLASR